MCGIIGIYSNEEVVEELYDGMISIQHRGQDAAGIVTFDGKFHIRKKRGLVREVLKQDDILKLKGKIGIGHLRYTTAGSGDDEDAQPFVASSPFGIAMAHNGNVTNYTELIQELKMNDLRHINSDCDVEIILNVFADELHNQDIKNLNENHIFTAVENVYKRVKGSYSVVAFIANYGMVFFRDPYGIRPLIMGEKQTELGISYAAASESVTLDALEYSNKRNIQPGEVIFIDKNKQLHSKQVGSKPHHPCIFEYVYFARPDSFIDKVSVYKSRLRAGKELAKLWDATGLEADVIIPIPESSKPAALGMSQMSGIKYREGFFKNSYVGRTFIMPENKQRKKSIKQKLNPIRIEFNNKNVILVDDSIVRGNTSKKIIQMVREAGAKKVYFVSASPPVQYRCIYGVDMSTKNEFIAKNKTVNEIKEEIGADYLLYLDNDSLIKTAQTGNPDLKTFCTACFSGNYPTGDVTNEMLDKIEEDRLNAKDGQI